MLFNKLKHIKSNYDVTHFRASKLQRHLLNYSLAPFQLLTVFFLFVAKDTVNMQLPEA